jgi:O-antigen/teichoic acid export membrane protein
MTDAIPDGLDRGPEGQYRPNIARMIRSASGTAVLQAASTGLGFVTSIVLARSLGRTGYGQYALAFAWSGFLLIPALLGMDRFLVRGIATYEVEHRWSLARGLLRRTNELVLLASVLIACLGCVVALTCLSPTLRAPFCVAMTLIPVTALTTLRQGAMQAMGRVVRGQLPEYLIRPLLILVGIGTLAFIGHGILTPTTALAVVVAGVAVAFAVGALQLRRASPAVLRSARASYLTRDWLRASVPMMLIGGLWMANSYVGTLAVGALAGPRAAGVYSIVEKGAAVIVLVLVATNMPLAPAIARLHAAGDREGLERAVEQVARISFVISIPICAAFAIFPNIYLSIFGPGFADGSMALTVLALGQLVNAAAGPAGNVLLMSGQERVALRGVGAGLLVNLVLAVALVPPLGVTGGAIAFSLSLVVWNTSFVLAARKHVGVNVTAFRALAIATARGDV